MDVFNGRLIIYFYHCDTLRLPLGIIANCPMWSMDYLMYRLDLIRQTLYYLLDQNTTPIEGAAYSVISSTSLAISAQAFEKVFCHAEKSLIQWDWIWFQSYALPRNALTWSSKLRVWLTWTWSRYAVVICKKPAAASGYFIVTLVVNIGLLDR